MDEPKNPIEKRFDKLEGLWNEFTENAEARLLRWLVDQESLRMIDLFVELQNEEAGRVPDLFVRFSDKFTSGPEYCSALISSLARQYSEIQQGIADEGIDAEWQAPSLESASMDDVVSVFVSLQQHYSSIMEHFVAVLVPQNADLLSDQWAAWLSQLLSREIPSPIRFMVVDDSETQTLAEFAEQHPELVMSIDPELDMPAAYEQIAREAPGSGPGHDFRLLYVKLTNAAGAGDLNSAKTAGQRAIAIATEQKWPQMVTVAQMALGAAYFGAGQIDETIACYQAANAAVAGSDDPTEKKLDVQTRMAEGAAYIAAEKYSDAAEVYSTTAPLAEQVEDVTSWLECSRMAGYCYEVDGCPEQAWDWGEKAVSVGAAMDPADRDSSTLPYAGQMLIRIADNGTHSDQKQRIQNQMEQLLGADWEKKIEEATS